MAPQIVGSIWQSFDVNLSVANDSPMVSKPNITTENVFDDKND